MRVRDAFFYLQFVRPDIADITGVERLFMANALNHELYSVIRDSNPEQLLTDFTFTTTQGDEYSQALPSDFKTLQDLQTGVFVYTNNKIGQSLPKVQYNSRDKGYYFKGDNIVIVNPDNETLLMRYIPTLAQLTSLDDNFVVGDRWQELVQFGLLLRYAISDQDRAMEADADQRYRLELDAFRNEISETVQTYPLEDISNYYG